MDILLVEDDKDFQQQLVTQLAIFGHEIQIAEDGPAALSLIGQTAFDIVILNWRMSGLDGISLLHELREGGMNIPILILSDLAQILGKVECFEAGADDYVVKAIDPRELNARLHALVRARQAQEKPSDTLSAGDIVISPSRLQAWRKGRPLNLSQTEFKLLLILVRNAGSVVSRPMIIEHIWGHGFIPVANIVDAHIRHLRTKLLAYGDDPISTRRGMGYVLRA